MRAESDHLDSVNIWTMTWVRQVDALRETLGNESDHDYHEVDTTFVPYQVPGDFTSIDERRPRLAYVGRASRIVPLVFCRNAGHDEHQAWSGVTVPAECPAGCDRVLQDIEMRLSMRVDHGPPDARAWIEILRREDIEGVEGTIGNWHGCHAGRECCTGRRGDGDERQCDEK